MLIGAHYLKYLRDWENHLMVYDQNPEVAFFKNVNKYSYLIISSTVTVQCQMRRYTST